jgi:hypothetical protein
MALVLLPSHRHHNLCTGIANGKELWSKKVGLSLYERKDKRLKPVQQIWKKS